MVTGRRCAVRVSVVATSSAGRGVVVADCFWCQRAHDGYCDIEARAAEFYAPKAWVLPVVKRERSKPPTFVPPSQAVPDSERAPWVSDFKYWGCGWND